MPSLSEFIRQSSKLILLEWEGFARSFPLGASMSVQALRDHAQAMLEVITTDLETPQTALEQSEKSKGLARERRRLKTAAAEHGSGRAESGFTVVQMVAEFRALRASVVRLWTAQQETFGQADLDDLIRFNEAIDQAIAESLDRYSREIDETRERFLAILGHDLRNPIGAIMTSTSFLLETGDFKPDQTTLIQNVQNASRRMNVLVGDLLDLALTRLGDGIPISRAATDLGKVIDDVVVEVRASYPLAQIEAHANGDLQGEWDSARLAQALTNLVGNAVHHGDVKSPISVATQGDAREVTITVHNRGPAIPREILERIFEGMKPDATGNRDGGHLGLGLFIVDKIVVAHGGTIDVQSTDQEGTSFTVHLPKSPPADRRRGRG